MRIALRACFIFFIYAIYVVSNAADLAPPVFNNVPPLSSALPPIPTLPSLPNIQNGKLTNSDVISESYTGERDTIDPLQQERYEVIKKYLGTNYDTYKAPEALYKREKTTTNNHIPPVYFISYYINLAYKAISENNLDVLRYFIEDYKLHTVQDNEGDSLLIRSAMYGKLAPARLLLANKSDINTTNIAGKTALHYACINGDYRMAKLLLSMGANTLITDRDGNKAEHYANNSKNHLLISLLKEYS